LNLFEATEDVCFDFLDKNCEKNLYEAEKLVKILLDCMTPTEGYLNDVENILMHKEVSFSKNIDKMIEKDAMITLDFIYYTSLLKEESRVS